MKYLHTMIRVSNIEKYLEFYFKGLGLKEIRYVENENGKYRLVFSTPAVFDLSGGRATY